MEVPKRIPGLRAATVLLTVYGLVWVSLEGSLAGVILLAIGLSLVALGFLAQGSLGGHRLTRGRWLIAVAFGGALLGFSIAILSLVFMAVKTGLHAHGPEFSPAEITWVMKQIPLWIGAGLLAGLGLGLLAIARFKVS